MHLPERLLFLKNKELNELYACMGIRSLAVSMIGIFVPIYLLQLGYSLVQVFLFYAVYSLFHSVTSLGSIKIACRHGFKRAILFSTPFLISFFLLLAVLETQAWGLFLAAVIIGTSSSLFWTGYHLEFATFSEKKNRGKSIGFIQGLVRISSALGPLLGGFLAMTVGFPTLFAIVSTLLITSVIPLFFSSDEHVPLVCSYKHAFVSTPLNNYLAYLGANIETNIAKVIWPIFIYFNIFNDFTKLGFVTSLSLVFAVVFGGIGSVFSDINRKLTLRISSVLRAIVWFGRMFATTGLHVIITDSLYGMTHSGVSASFDAINYDIAEEKRAAEVILLRELVNPLGGVLFFLFMAFVTSYTASWWIAIFSTLLLLVF